MASYAGVLRHALRSDINLKPVLKTINNSRCRAWDLAHGVDTCGEIPLTTLDFESSNKTFGLEYQSHHPEIIRSALRALDVRHQDYTFVDVGCGKGRVLLVALEFPFRKVIGLEFAPSLAETARQNLLRYRGRRRCNDVEVITGDATEYEFGSEAQVLYFYSPFSPRVLNGVVRRVEESFQRSPREMLVVFSGVLSMRDRGFGSSPDYVRLVRSAHMDIFRHRPLAAHRPESRTTIGYNHVSFAKLSPPALTAI